MTDTPYPMKWICRINQLNEYAVLDRKLDTSYPMEVNTPYSAIDQNNRIEFLWIRRIELYSSVVFDAKLNFMEEHVEILEREFKKLKRSRIAIVKVRWNSKCGPEFTWEREDQMRLKYPHLFSSSSS
ncbi:hypothetical protein Tco_0990758 [Tanacetum coccineum]|uniref:Reverse transcriptase domain-containing protein n=1 Tax=Tanacetum coccineum TaxID=301880 RepID=A0ABQ5EY19_9ASTR